MITRQQVLIPGSAGAARHDVTARAAVTVNELRLVVVREVEVVLANVVRCARVAGRQDSTDMYVSVALRMFFTVQLSLMLRL